MGLALGMAWSAGCDPVPEPVPRVPQVETGPCDESPEQYGCPGNPCAHGWCFEGRCEGARHDRLGELVDPGVCCIDDACDAR